ncbi:MAG: hypothetical protein ACE5JI_07470, partial [Acidobacteriota bacterium]
MREFLRNLRQVQLLSILKASFRWTGLVAGGAFILVSVDRAAPVMRLDVDGFWDSFLFETSERYNPRGFRIVPSNYELRLDGLWSQTPVSVSVAIANARPRTQVLSVYSEEILVRRLQMSERQRVVSFSSRSTAGGALRIRFEGTRRLRVWWIRVRQGPGGGVPWQRLAHYVVLLTCSVALGTWAGNRTTGVLLLGIVTVSWSALIAVARLHAMAYLPTLVLGFGLSLALAFACAFWAQMPRRCAAWLVAAFGFRLLLVLHPVFEGIDLWFHA